MYTEPPVLSKRNNPTHTWAKYLHRPFPKKDAHPPTQLGEDPQYHWPLAECGLTSAGAPLGAGADSHGPLLHAKCGKLVKRTGTWESSWELSQQSEHKFIDDPASLHHRSQRDIWKRAHPRRWTRACTDPQGLMPSARGQGSSEARTLRWMSRKNTRSREARCQDHTAQDSWY